MKMKETSCIETGFSEVLMLAVLSHFLICTGKLDLSYCGLDSHLLFSESVLFYLKSVPWKQGGKMLVWRKVNMYFVRIVVQSAVCLGKIFLFNMKLDDGMS